jgi:diguanylate cyclase (GGDEF)-like protein
MPPLPESLIEPAAGSAPLLRAELLGRFRGLRFAPRLEPGFVQYLRTSQHRNLVICMLVTLATLVVFVGVDLVRYRGLAGLPQQSAFFDTVMVPRWGALAVLLAGTWAVAVRWVGRWLVPLVVALIAVYALATFYITHRLLDFGMPSAPGIGMLVVMVVFFPCALLFYEALLAALLAWLIATLLGTWMLPEALLPAHWSYSVVMLFALAVAAMNGYMREHAMREQYLLRHLLDWDAGHDPETGLANRRNFAEHGPMAMAQARRENQPLSFALIDVDHFKAYNDHYGHQAGDKALRRVGRLIAGQVRRPLDLAVRLGGEEFVIFAYGEEASSLSVRLYGLLLALEQQPIAHSASPTAPWLSVSMGVAQAREGDTLDTLYQRADALLYRAKDAGRNRIEVQDGDGFAAGEGADVAETSPGGLG